MNITIPRDTFVAAIETGIAACDESIPADDLRVVGLTAVACAWGTYFDGNAACGCPLYQAGISDGCESWEKAPEFARDFTDAYDDAINAYVEEHYDILDVLGTSTFTVTD